MIRSHQHCREMLLRSSVTEGVKMRLETGRARQGNWCSKNMEECTTESSEWKWLGLLDERRLLLTRWKRVEGWTELLRTDSIGNWRSVYIERRRAERWNLRDQRLVHDHIKSFRNIKGPVIRFPKVSDAGPDMSRKGERILQSGCNSYHYADFYEIHWKKKKQRNVSELHPVGVCPEL